MKEEILRDFLHRYADRYLDYDVLYNNDYNIKEADYISICFCSSSLIIHHLTDEKIIEKINIRNTKDVFYLNLEPGYLYLFDYFETDTNNGHYAVLIPISRNKIIICQSIGGWMALVCDEISIYEMKRRIILLLIGNELPFMHFMDLGETNNIVKYDNSDNVYLIDTSLVEYINNEGNRVMKQEINYFNEENVRLKLIKYKLRDYPIPLPDLRFYENELDVVRTNYINSDISNEMYEFDRFYIEPGYPNTHDYISRIL